MKTLRDKFEESGIYTLLYSYGDGNVDHRIKIADEILSFIKQHALALIKEIEGKKMKLIPMEGFNDAVNIANAGRNSYNQAKQEDTEIIKKYFGI
jgi:hypothetical protein